MRSLTAVRPKEKKRKEETGRGRAWAEMLSCNVAACQAPGFACETGPAMTTDVRQISLSRLQQFLALTKPRVVSLIVFTAVIGMFLATPGMVPLQALVFGTLGIGLVAGAAAAVNCLVEQKVDAVMARTRARPLPMGQVTSLQTLLFAGVVGGISLIALYTLVNPLTMWLT